MASLHLSIFSLDELGVPHVEQNDLCYLPHHEWLRLMHLDCPDILLLEIIQGDVRRVLTVGEGHHMGDFIYIPYNCIGAFEEGGDVIVRRYLEMPPIASQITIQPLDDFYQCDIASAVSKVLANMNILHIHTTLKVPCEELGDYVIEVFIKACEPADIVLLRGECPLEIATSVDDATASSATALASTDPPVPVWTPSTEVEEVPETIIRPLKNGFIPFSGSGNRLGG